MDAENIQSSSSFFGLLLYLTSHVVVIYYLIWILLDNLHDFVYSHDSTIYIEAYTEILQYFPSNRYRIILPGLLVAFLVVYFTYVWIMRQIKIE